MRSVTEDMSDSAKDFGGSSTTLSAVRAEVRQASTSSTPGVAGTSSSPSDTSGPSEGGVHGWWVDRADSSPSLSVD